MLSFAVVCLLVVSYAMFKKTYSVGFTACEIPERLIGSFTRVEGGGFIHGLNGIYPEEGAPSKVMVSPFMIQINEVTNTQFAEFVTATGYVTEAERNRGSAQFVNTDTPWDVSSWWGIDEGATWKAPFGEDSDLQGKGQHPVVHVSLNDAKAYANWAGGRLPTEVEWEYAASLGMFDSNDPESGILGPNGEPRANIWTGMFPILNTEADGFAGTAPVGCYQKSKIGTYDMIGNVWEWTDSRFTPGTAKFTIKGGSYLCGSNFCRRYRAAARQSLEYDFSTAHVGFRIVKDV